MWFLPLLKASTPDPGAHRPQGGRRLPGLGHGQGGGEPAPGTRWWPPTRARARVLCHVPAPDTCGLRDSAPRAIPPRAAAPSKSWPWTAQAHAQDCPAAVCVPHRGGKDTHTGVSHASRPGASAGLQDSGHDLGVTLLPDLHVNGGQDVGRDGLHQTHTEWGQDGCRALGHHPRPAQGRAGWTRGQWPPEATAASGIDLGASRWQRPRLSARAPNAQRDSLGHGPEAGQGRRRSLGSTPLAPLRSAENPVFQQHWSRPGRGALTWHLGNPWWQDPWERRHWLCPTRSGGASSRPLCLPRLPALPPPRTTIRVPPCTS